MNRVVRPNTSLPVSAQVSEQVYAVCAKRVGYVLIVDAIQNRKKYCYAAFAMYSSEDRSLI
jgi:hypothetical protein